MLQQQWSGDIKLRQPSAHEGAVLAQLQSMQCKGLVAEFQWELRLLSGKYGAVDAWIPGSHIAIMVDGEHHHTGEAA
jgi:hypothetical protein